MGTNVTQGVLDNTQTKEPEEELQENARTSPRYRIWRTVREDDEDSPYISGGRTEDSDDFIMDDDDDDFDDDDDAVEH